MMVRTRNRTSDTALDPPKLNRGQLIHFRAENNGLTDSVSNSSNVCDSYKTVVEKKECENVVFCDWFEMTLTRKNVHFDSDVASLKIADNLYLEKTEKRTAHYDAVYNVIYMGEHFGTLLAVPRANFMNPLSIQFKINNDHLYRCDWLDSFKEILSISGWSPASLTRLDIAIDGVAGEKGMDISKRHLNGRTIGRKGKASMTVTYDGKKDIKRFHVGSVSSEKSATIYHKTKEIEKSEKEYIRNAWKMNNLIGDGEVYRFELRMKSKVTVSYDWQRMDDPNYLASIAFTECKNWFEFYYMGKDKNKYRLHKNGAMNWMDWDDIKGELLPKNKAITKTGLHRAKRLIKDAMYLNYVEGKELPASLIIDLKNEYSLHKWLEIKVHYWHSEWDRIKRLSNINSN